MPFDRKLLAAALVSTLASSQVLAQSVGALEEVIVMATKREQTLQEVPIAVSVVNVQTLEQAQINDILDLSKLENNKLEVVDEPVRFYDYIKEQLAQSMFDHTPVGVGSKGIIPMTAK